MTIFLFNSFRPLIETNYLLIGKYVEMASIHKSSSLFTLGDFFGNNCDFFVLNNKKPKSGRTSPK
jgi:hypothetical protein